MNHIGRDINKAKILIVDDDLYISKIMRAMLEAFEVARVVMVANFDEAIITLKNHPFDCLFVDNMMCPKNGLTLAKYIRKSTDIKLQKTPIILYTTRTGLQSVIQARDAGVTEILTKPVSPEQLLAKLNNALFKERPFIATEEYSGPDRRRRLSDMETSEDRRVIDIPLPKEEEKIILNGEGNP